MKVKTYLQLALVLTIGAGTLWAQPTDASAEAEYTRVITDRADKIVAPLGITDPAKTTRVRDIIVQQYRDLAAIHDARDEKIKAARSGGDAEKNRVEASVEAARQHAQTRLDKLHGEFLGRLAKELTSEQVDQVKDGLTYGVLHVTYDAYLKSFPNLTVEQKKQLKDWLVEAREIAMDQGSSREKHGVFGKYKGRINNYLVKNGYDLKEGERNLRATMQKPAAPAAR